MLLIVIFFRVADGEDPLIHTSQLAASEMNNAIEDSYSTPMQDEKKSKNKNDKLFFTVWTKTISTTTMTVYYTNTATTLSLSYYCTVGGITIPFLGC